MSLSKTDKYILEELKKLVRVYNDKYKKEFITIGEGESAHVIPIEYLKKDIKHNLKDLLGKEYKNIKGQDAINKVYKEREGHVSKAFYRNGIGYITVCWGDDTCGLKHLEKERLDRKQNPKEIIKILGKVIEKGSIYKEKEDRWEIRYKDATVIISKELKNEKVIAIITGYKKSHKRS